MTRRTEILTPTERAAHAELIAKGYVSVQPDPEDPRIELTAKSRRPEHVREMAELAARYVRRMEEGGSGE